MSTLTTGRKSDPTPTQDRREGVKSATLVCSHCGSDDWTILHTKTGDSLDGIPPHPDWQTYCCECDTYDIELINPVVRLIIEETDRARLSGARSVIAYVSGALLNSERDQFSKADIVEALKASLKGVI